MARWGLGLLAIFILFFAIAGFFFPDWLISLWVWPLAPLSARIITGWFALLAVGGIVISRDSRWSAWKTGLESIALWQLLVVIGAVVHKSDFKTGLLNWYLVGVVLVLIGMASLLYAVMETKRHLVVKTA